MWLSKQIVQFRKIRKDLDVVAVYLREPKEFFSLLILFFVEKKENKFTLIYGVIFFFAHSSSVSELEDKN